MITLLHTLLSEALSRNDILEVLEYAKQMQDIYTKIYKFESVKFAGKSMLANYGQLRKNNSMLLVRKVAHNNEVITGLRKDMEVFIYSDSGDNLTSSWVYTSSFIAQKLNERLVENQLVIQQELLKQIKIAKWLKAYKQGQEVETEAKEETMESVYTDIMKSIRENFEIVKAHREKYHE